MCFPLFFKDETIGHVRFICFDLKTHPLHQNIRAEPSDSIYPAAINTSVSYID